MKVRLPLILLAAAALWAAGGCGSDPDTPLGAEFLDDGLIDSDPGETFQDTIRVTSGDASFVTNSTINKAQTMTFGRKNDVETAMMVRIDFSDAGADTLKVVERAYLALRVTSDTQTDVIDARFFEFLTPFSEDDSLTALDISSTPIPDSTGVNTDRVMRFFPSTYTFEPGLIQDWIRGDQDHNGIAVVINDPATDVQLNYGTRTNAAFDKRPFLRVFFMDGTDSSYDISDDGTFVTDLAPPTTDLVLSDGVTRRIYMPIDLSTFNPDVLLHDARLVLRIVAKSFTGGENAVEVYAPPTDDLGSPDILEGEFVIGTFLPSDTTVTRIIIPVRARIEEFIADPSTNYGLVLRFAAEGSTVRSVKFYSSTNVDSLKPFLDLTYSDPPRFPRP